MKVGESEKKGGLFGSVWGFRVFWFGVGFLCCFLVWILLFFFEGGGVVLFVCCLRKREGIPRGSKNFERGGADLFGGYFMLFLKLAVSSFCSKVFWTFVGGFGVGRCWWSFFGRKWFSIHQQHKATCDKRYENIKKNGIETTFQPS